jgi:hypothetical protein
MSRGQFVKSDQFGVWDTLRSKLVETQSTSEKAIKAAKILNDHSENCGSGRVYCVRTRKQIDCPHYEDNQGFCHSCGIMMNEERYEQYSGESWAGKEVYP